MLGRSSPAEICVHCDREEFSQIDAAYTNGTGLFVNYSVRVPTSCRRCGGSCIDLPFGGISCLPKLCGLRSGKRVNVYVPVDTDYTVQRLMDSAAATTAGTPFRVHGNFIYHLQHSSMDPRVKAAYQKVFPQVYMMYHVHRQLHSERSIVQGLRNRRVPFLQDRPPDPPPPEVPPPVPPPENPPEPEQQGEENPPDAVQETENATNVVEHLLDPPPNGDLEGNKLPATQLEGNEYGQEDRVVGESIPPEPKNLAQQIGPDLIPVEAFGNTEGNVRAAMKKRIDPLPFEKVKRNTSHDKTVKNINKTVNALMKVVFTKEKVHRWREENCQLLDGKSKKWSEQRWENAYDNAMQDIDSSIQQSFQIKTNEAGPSKGKAPRIIINLGDEAQVMANLPIKCVEDLTFEFFKEASIKGIDKPSAISRVCKRLRLRDGNSVAGRFSHVIEGDGSSWDTCCNSTIRGMTENRIIREVIRHLSGDNEVPDAWLQKVMNDLDKPTLKGKVKIDGEVLTPLKALIVAIRQSGHRGTSVLNYLINLIVWLSVMCEEPDKMIGKTKDGRLFERFRCRWCPTERNHFLRYAFEGDDSALTSTIDFLKYESLIETAWTACGFRMKLNHDKIKKYITFVGYDILTDDYGTTDTFIPEIPRNIASCAWSTSPLLKQDPSKVSQVGVSAFYARAISFQHCGAFCRYFSSIGLAHASTLGSDFSLSGRDAEILGVEECAAVVQSLRELNENCEPMSEDMFRLVNRVVPLTRNQENHLLSVTFEDPYDLDKARLAIPYAIWNPHKYNVPRR